MLLQESDIIFSQNRISPDFSKDETREAILGKLSVIHFISSNICPIS